MSYHPPEELLERWKREELSVEQMIGQMLQVLADHQRRLRELAQATPPSAEPADPREPSKRRLRT